MATAGHQVVDNIPKEFSYRPDLATAATPRDLQLAPRHRWFYFPHSYSYRLVDEVLDYWDLQEGAVLADNFVGSGTTLLVARQREIPAMGYDLSPLAVTVSNAKIGAYRPKQLRNSLSRVLADDADVAIRTAPSDRLDRAFTKLELHEFHRLTKAINNLPRHTRIFFQTAILSMVPEFSRAVADGGWLQVEGVVGSEPSCKAQIRRSSRAHDRGCRILGLAEAVSFAGCADGGCTQTASSGPIHRRSHLFTPLRESTRLF